MLKGRVWRYQRGNQNPYIEEQHNGQKKKYKRTNNDLHNMHLVVYWPFKCRDHYLVQCKNNMLFLCNCDITNLHCIGCEYISGHFKQYFCNIVAIIFIAGWIRRDHRNPPIYLKSTYGTTTPTTSSVISVSIRFFGLFYNCIPTGKHRRPAPPTFGFFLYFIIIIIKTVNLYARWLTHKHIIC
jgi:hypothetical protein